MLLHRVGEGTEDDPQLRQLCPKRRPDRDAVKHGVDRDASQQLLLLERNPELLERGADFRIDLVETVERRPLLGRRVIDDVLVVDRRVVHVLPRRLGHREPGAIRLQAPLEQPRRLAFLLGDQPDDLLVETLRNGLGFDIGDEAVRYSRLASSSIVRVAVVIDGPLRRPRQGWQGECRRH